MDRRLLTLQLLLVSSRDGVAGGDNMHIEISILQLLVFVVLVLPRNVNNIHCNPWFCIFTRLLVMGTREGLYIVGHWYSTNQVHYSVYSRDGFRRAVETRPLDTISNVHMKKLALVYGHPTSLVRFTYA